MEGLELVLWCALVRFADTGCGDNAGNKPLLFNGHYVRFSSQKAGQEFLNENRYIPKNIVFTRFQLCADRVFVTAPRYRHGVPFTLGTTPLHGKRCLGYEAYVDPFPYRDAIGTGTDMCIHTLVNAVDLVMGTDGILWVLDVGVADTLDDVPSVESDPKVIGYDVATGTERHSISLQPFIKNKSRYHYLVVEEVDEGTTMLYVGDGGSRSIITWDVQKDQGNRVELPYFVEQGCTVNPVRDTMYIALIEGDAGDNLYFSYESSHEIFRIGTKSFRKQTCVGPKSVAHVGEKPGKMCFVGVGYGSVVYFRYNDGNDLYSWDTRVGLLEENWNVVRANRDCRTTTHVDVDNNGTLWVMESDINDFVNGRTGCYGTSVLLYPVVHDRSAGTSG